MENYQNYNVNDEWKEREFRKGEDRQRKSYRDSSPEEVKQAVKEQVSKGVAAAAGAVEGFAEEMENDHIPETVGKAIELTGETTRTIAETTVEQAKRTKEAFTGKKSLGSQSEIPSGYGSDYSKDEL